MLAIDLLVTIAQGLGLGALERLLGFLGQFVDIHSVIPSLPPVLNSMSGPLAKTFLSLHLSLGRYLRELSVELALAVGEVLGNHDADLRQQVPLAAAGLREPAPPQPDLAAGGGARRDLHPQRAGGGLDVRLAAQRGHRRMDRDVGQDVRPLDPVARIGRDLDLQEQIARRSAAEPRRALSGQADPLARAHPLGDLDRQRLALPRIRVRDGDLPRAAADRLLDRQSDRRLGVASRLGAAAEAGARSSETRRAAAPPAPRATSEEHLEEVAEPRAAAGAPEVAAPLAEVEVDPLPPRRRTALAPAHPIPVGAELVVLLPLVRVLQDLVGLADLLELDLGLRVLVDVRMKLPRHLPVRLLDVLLGRFLLDAQRCVVVLVFQEIVSLRLRRPVLQKV